MENGLHIVLGDETRTIVNIDTLAEPPSQYWSLVRNGRFAHDLWDCALVFEDGKRRYVYFDGEPYIMARGGTPVRLDGDLLELVETLHGVTWRAADVPPRKRRAPGVRMPEIVTSDVVTGVMSWPLGNVKTHTSAGEGWTDCLLMFVDEIRLGGKYNSRRVRYDGAFYIMHNGRRVGIGGALVFDVLDVASHVYGIDAESDKIHNKRLKGY